jgi:hypothetical protein
MRDAHAWHPGGTQFVGREVGILFLAFGAVLIVCSALLIGLGSGERMQPEWVAGLVMLVGGGAFALYGEFLRNQVPGLTPEKPAITDEELAAAGVPMTVRTPGALPLLGEILIYKYHLVTEKDLKHALLLQIQSGKRLGQVLVEMGLITRDDLERALEDQLSYGDPWHRAPGEHHADGDVRPTATTH